MTEQMINNLAKSLNTTPENLTETAAQILTEKGPDWQRAGHDENACNILSVRVAAQMIGRENAQMSRSGATRFEGMFISVPRAKEWGKILYNKMKNQLETLPPEAADNFIRDGNVVMFHSNGDGTYQRRGKAAFFNGGNGDDIDETTVSELPRHTVTMSDGTTAFYVVWDKNNPTYPSGDPNFKYGKPRPQDERERTCLFLGRKEGTNDEPSLITVKAEGKAADNLYPPTFVAGTIALKTGRNPAVAYAVKNGLSVFNSDVTKQGVFTNEPIGIVQSILEGDFLPNFDTLETFINENEGTDGWYDRNVAVIGEVIHMDPRDNGGCVLIVSDLDITSLAPPQEVFVSGVHSEKVDFAIGTKVMLFGQVWRTREGDIRLTVNGWYPHDIIAAANGDDVSLDADEGWDA